MRYRSPRYHKVMGAFFAKFGFDLTVYYWLTLNSHLLSPHVTPSCLSYFYDTFDQALCRYEGLNSKR